MCFFRRNKNNRTPATEQEDARPSWYLSLPGQVYKMWPKQGGEPEEPAFLKHCTSVDMEDEMLINMLTAYNIPAVKLYPGSGSFGKVVLGMSGEGANIYVPVSMLDDAAALIGGNEND